MQVPMKITSITVPTDTNVVLVGVDLGIPGANGEFRFSPTEARQFGHDLIGAADATEPVVVRAPRNYTLKCDPGDMRHFGENIA